MKTISAYEAIIIGAGASGIFAARALNKQGIKNITILEKNARIGGMCHSYVENDLYAEYGALFVFPTSREVLEAIGERKQKDIILQKALLVDQNTIGIYDKIKNLTFKQKIIFFGSFIFQLAKFFKHVHRYRKLRDSLQSLPEDYLLPFAQFARKYKMTDITLLLEPYIAGCGYGSLEECESEQLFEAMGYGLMLNLSLIQAFAPRNVMWQIKGGVQSFIEKLAEGFDIKKSANIDRVSRSKEKVEVHYEQHGKRHSIKADILVLAISPLHWEKMGLELTDYEQNMVDKLVYYHYPVAICKIKGMPAQSAFFTHTLTGSKYTYMGSLQTRDCRFAPSDGRLYTVYVTMPPGAHNFSFKQNNSQAPLFMQELKSKFSAIKEITLIDEILWEGYMPKAEWAARCELERKQFDAHTRTIYVGAYTLGCFETIASVSEKATKIIEKTFGSPNKYSYLKMPTFFLTWGIAKETLVCEERHTSP